MTEVSSTLSSLSGIPVTAYGPLKGSIENWNVDGPAVSAFEELGRRTHTFVAYDGNRIIMASADEVTISVIDLGGRNEASAMRIVRMFFPVTPPGAIVYDPEVSALVVRGPKQFADAIETGLTRTMHAPGPRALIVKYGTKEFVASDE